jgi:hypothetical protein
MYAGGKQIWVINTKFSAQVQYFLVENCTQSLDFGRLSLRSNVFKPIDPEFKE